MQLPIKTERLCITEFDESMAESVHLNSLDEDNRRFIPDEVFETARAARETIASLLSFYALDDKPLVYPILLHDGRQIGHIQAIPVSCGWEVGYHIAKAHTGNGYAAEAVNAFLPPVMERLHITHIYGVCDAENIASRKVLEKCGFILTYEGVGILHGEEQLICRYEKTLCEVNENEIEIVKRLSGIEDDSRVRASEIGWTSHTYIIDNGKIVFKFPRNTKFRNECKKEVSVLELLKNHKFSVSTPILNWTTDDHAYFGFYGVEGKPLGDVIHTLNDEQKIDIGTQLGKFLKQLHSITDYGEINAQTPTEQTEEYTKMYQKDRNLLEAFFDETELKIIDDFFVHEVPKCMAGSGELVFCHGDLDYNNTLVNDNNQVGVIDFGDAGLYDKSQDFRGMDDDTLREAMMKAYGAEEIVSLAAAKDTSNMIDILNLPYIIKNRDRAERDECIGRIRANFFRKAKLRTCNEN